MSRLIVDISELAHWEGRLTGVPRVMDELAGRFAGEADTVFVAWESQQGGYREVDPKNLPAAAAPLPQPAARPTGLVARAARKLHAGTGQPTGPSRTPTIVPGKGDVLFVLADWHGSDPAFVDYLVAAKRSGVSLVQMAYDLLPIVTPQYSGHATASLTRYTKAIYPLCDLILAISKHTRQDITDWLKQNKLNVPDIEIIRLGDDFKLADPAKPSGRYFAGADKEFILCVGTIEARKNHALLYYTYKLAVQRSIALPDLVIVGRRGWKSDDIYELMTNDPQTKDKFIILESASDRELAWLYKHCQFSVYPSFYEGWGLPIAESIAYNTPCICSNTSSMPEIAGDLIPYFSPYSPDECLAAMQNMLKTGAIAKAKRKIERYEPVSWDETSGLVTKLIKELHV